MIETAFLVFGGIGLVFASFVLLVWIGSALIRLDLERDDKRSHGE